VVIDGKVYDLTDFAEKHPAGADKIHNLAGKDASRMFHFVHTNDMLENFKPVGVLEQQPPKNEINHSGLKVIPRKELHKHWGPDDC
jgi:cytochrome b involved in lipid metabolism